MLSPAKGQEFAVAGGFHNASEEVQEIETYDVISRWTLITTAGLLEDIIETSDWFCELDEVAQLEDAERDQLRRTLISHSVGLVNKILDSGKVVLILEMEDEDE